MISNATPADPFSQLDAYVDRHLGLGPGEEARREEEAMLESLGAASIDALIDEVVPESIRYRDRLALTELDAPLTAEAAQKRLAELASRNDAARAMIGQGYHDTITPAVLRRNVLQNPGWYTAYTPYQPEASQGRLEALLNYQQAVIDLTGLPLANASLLDEATAVAEAIALVRRQDRKAPARVLVDHGCHPQTLGVVATRCRAAGVELVVDDAETRLRDGAWAAVVVQNPDTFGRVRDPRPILESIREAGAVSIVVSDPLALVLLEGPGTLGADVVVGSMQRFGVPMGFGGPHAAFMAAAERFRRSMPGRIIGVSHDAGGRPALRMALQTREQHIRREKATSNICTAQVLLAIVSGLYAVWHGPEGLRRIARRTHHAATEFARGLAGLGVERVNETWFDTITLRAPGRADAILSAAERRGLQLRRVDADTVSVACDETTDRAAVDAALQAVGEAVGRSPAGPGETPARPLPESALRSGGILEHPVFHRHQTETEMMRYLRSLEQRDIALNRSMIPLGSCTMKLNAAAAMEPISWPGLANIHPYAPASATGGYREIVGQLSGWLAEATGLPAVSMQPNAGSQGEYAGLLAIRRHHAARGQAERDVCLIPSSAHGTNPASAVMAGLRVVVVDCDEQGNVDLADLEAKAAEHADRLAALMITYPSTHGVFEVDIRAIVQSVHAHGGQVYMDGANFNAMVGLARPGDLGVDVMHLNLHKTFAIPHGGGGPGVGPIAAAAHLAAYLPGDPTDPDAGAVAAAPQGSAGVLPISWMYVAMLGASGMRRASETAILAANYIADRLQPHFPVLYRGDRGRVAHECIIDLRPIREEVGSTVDDVAKRLIDYGFHAPTMSWPVAGTLMIEPTESESKRELDRFCDAMIAIRKEIDRVAAGDWPKDDNPLVNAPHPAVEVTAGRWTHPYPREVAAYPAPGQAVDKYWPPVSRVDQVAGDRHLVCTCPPISAYGEQEASEAAVPGAAATT